MPPWATFNEPEPWNPALFVAGRRWTGFVCLVVNPLSGAAVGNLIGYLAGGPVVTPGWFAWLLGLAGLAWLTVYVCAVVRWTRWTRRREAHRRQAFDRWLSDQTTLNGRNPW